MLFIQLQGVANKTVVNVALVAPCLRRNKLEKSGVQSFIQSPELETLCWVAGGKRQGNSGDWNTLVLAPDSYGFSIQGTSRSVCDLRLLTLTRLEKTQILAAFPQAPLPVCLQDDTRCKNWGSKEAFLLRL